MADLQRLCKRPTHASTHRGLKISGVSSGGVRRTLVIILDGQGPDAGRFARLYLSRDEAAELIALLRTALQI